MNKIVNDQNGYALLMTLLSLALLSILGLSIIGVTTSNFQMTKIDSRSQSAHYIAEAGYNLAKDKMYTDAEKDNLDVYTVNNTFEYEEFEISYGHQPKAIVTISPLDSDVNKKNFMIESIGKIGDSKSKFSKVVSFDLTNNEDDGNKIISDFIFYSKKFSFHGSSVNAKSGTIVMDGIDSHQLNGGGALNVTNLYFNGPVKMNGGSASFGSNAEPGNILVNGDLELWNGTRNVYGDIRVNGKFRLKDAIIHGDVYVNGDLEMGWTPVIHKNIFYTGQLTVPGSYSQSLLNKLKKVDKVDSFEIPIVDFELREDNWYIKNGYVIKGNETGTIPHNAKMLVENYHNTNWQSISGDVVIVSKGDIILRGGSGFTGALIAPYGKVQYSGDGTFKGVIISKNEIKLPAGGNNFDFMSLEELFGDNIPIISKKINNK